MERYVIKREDRPGQMLKGLGIGSCNTFHPDQWTNSERIVSIPREIAHRDR